MGSNTFLSPPAKRSAPVPAMPDPNPSNKRSKPPPPPIPVPPGHVSFRLLCHSSRTGGVIGKSGSVIKQLQLDTGSKIRIEEAPAESPDRVITIVAPGGGGGGASSNGEVGQVSKGQEALVRVFERVLAVAAESDGAGMASAGGVVSCRLLVDANQVGSVIGKGGKVVEKIRRDCGVKIRVLTDKLPVCAGPTDEVIEIEGEISAVKNGLVAVSRCLQDCQLSNKTRVSGPQEPLPQVRVEIPAQYNPAAPMLSSSSISYAPMMARPLSLDSDRVSTMESKATQQQQVIFRILCSNDRIGSVIGKGGSIIKGLQSETGAGITIGNTVADCDERLITVTASESPESRYSAAQKTVVLVFSRVADAESGSSKGSPVTAKLVISSNQIGCLLGKGGAIISEMRKVTSTVIRIVGGDQVPKCVPANDSVIQISGEFMNVKDAIYHVTGRLRDNLFSGILSASGTRSNTSVPTEKNPYLPLRDAFQDPLRDTLVRDPLRHSLRDPLRDPSLRDLLRDPLMDPLRDTSRDTLLDPLRDTMMDPLRNTVRDPLRGPLRDPFMEPMRDPLPLSMPPSVGVSHSLSQNPISQNMDHIGFSQSFDHPISPRSWQSQVKSTHHKHQPFSMPPSVAVSHSLSQNPISQNMDHLELSQNFDHPTSPRSWASQTVGGLTSRGITDVGRGLASAKVGLENDSGSKSAFVTNTTVEIVIPENVFGSVYGENGINLARLRQISGAKVIVHEPRLGTSDRIIIISGTPDETQAAQSLLQAFILTGQP
ncbi:hypothetical protein Tsubulata_044944 [Turnera subulata]|uniref:K Homology domain-containing protein n=1 Tax=Turnera subulata TaxID=218843 RepID=A0A9Q0J996_9ROSI|nr:hypothetical protein Tsubulata_044944 [Turnera subulata]